AWMHQSQPLHLRSSTMRTPFDPDWTRAFSGQAVTQRASLQNLQAMATLSTGFKRRMRILDVNGFHLPSDFSNEHTASQMPQPVHLLGSTATNSLESNLVVCASFAI